MSERITNADRMFTEFKELADLRSASAAWEEILTRRARQVATLRCYISILRAALEQADYLDDEGGFRRALEETADWIDL